MPITQKNLLCREFLFGSQEYRVILVKIEIEHKVYEGSIFRGTRGGRIFGRYGVLKNVFIGDEARKEASKKTPIPYLKNKSYNFQNFQSRHFQFRS